MVTRNLSLPVLALLVSGCVADLGAGTSDSDPSGNRSGAGEGSDSPQCQSPSVAASPMRRLTRFEYNNTVRDLLGDETNPATNFSPEARQFGFDNNADGATYSLAVIEDYERVAGEVAARAVRDPFKLTGCDLEAEEVKSCLLGFVETFGAKAFRRPLLAEERERYAAFMNSSIEAYGHQEALLLFLSAILQSPHFLYRIEFGVAGAAEEPVVRLDGFETASRLSYLLWGSMPDEELYRAAENGELDSEAGVQRHAERMLEDERGAMVVSNFFAQWAHLHEVTNLEKRNSAFTPEIAELMEHETLAFVEYVAREGEGTMSALLTAPFSFLNEKLAAFYGIEGVEGEAFRYVELDPSKASGMMTQGALMARLAHPEQTSAVNRGMFVLEKLLCSAPPPPPNDIDATLPAADPSTTLREQLAAKTAEAPCSGCHELMNPIGFSFAHFNELGQWQADERGLPIDTSATISSTDTEGVYAGHTDLLAAVAQSDDMHECVSLDWFRYALGRDAGEADQCSVQGASQAFGDTGGSIKELLLALTQTPAFLYRTNLLNVAQLEGDD